MFANSDQTWHCRVLCPKSRETEGQAIDVDVYLEIADLFRFRWDPAVLAVLAERPYRFRALARQLEARINDHVDDNALSRSLHRLTRAKHVEATKTRVGRREVPVYTISNEGTRYLQTYGAFIATYQRLDIPDDRCVACCLHGRQAYQDPTSSERPHAVTDST